MTSVVSLQSGSPPALPIPVLQPVERESLRLPPAPVRVYAMGSVRIERGAHALTSLGGPKAGANQALGLFAFLFDRGDRGVEKDEAIEFIWPDVPLPMADSAFHRTMLGLRRSLSTELSIDTIRHQSGRFILAPGVVGWSDVAELEATLNSSAAVSDVATRVTLLERCRALGDGQYMDDCPFFGSSSYVEGRRSVLHAVREAILVELAELYDSMGHRALAVLRRGEARMAADDRGG